MNGDTLVARITPCLENGKTAYIDFLKEGQVGGARLNTSCCGRSHRFLPNLLIASRAAPSSETSRFRA